MSDEPTRTMPEGDSPHTPEGAGAPESAGDGVLARFGAALGGLGGRGLPPVERWSPPDCGDIDMRIDAEGNWFYNGSTIGRPALVRLFSTVLRKDGERYVLVTPVERVGIAVADVPFIAVEMAVDGVGDARRIGFRTNVGDLVEIGAEHPVRFDIASGVKPYIRVRADLWARLTRALTYDLVDLGEVREVEGREMFGVAASGQFYPISPADALPEDPGA